MQMAASQVAVRLSCGFFWVISAYPRPVLQQAKSEAGWARGQGGGRGRGRGDAAKQHFQTVFGGGGSQHSKSSDALHVR